MNMFRPHHVAEYEETIATAYLFENPEKQATACQGAQNGLPAVATEGEGVEVTVSVIALQPPRHENRLGMGLGMLGDDFPDEV
jgi:hypothetical protein